MAKVTFAINISIDGCYEHTLFTPNEELMSYFTQLMLNTDLIVYGRKTYELMVPYWPEVAESTTDSPCDIAFAKAMTPIEKIVLSRSLKHAPENTRIVNENPEGLIRELKQQPGINIAFSSVSLVPQLLTVGLIDELYLVVHPIIVGQKRRLFERLLVPEKLNFQLQNAQSFTSGAIALQYQKQDSL